MSCFFAVVFSSLVLSAAIFRGNHAGEGEYPYSVAVLQKGKVKCGGSLVTLRYVFTACQCVGSFEFEATEPPPTVGTTTTTTIAITTTPASTLVPLNNKNSTLKNATNVKATTRTTTSTTTTTTERAATGNGANLDTQASIKSFKSIPLNHIMLVAATNWIYEFGEGQVRRPDQSLPHPNCNGTTTPWFNDFGLYRVGHSFQNTFAIGLMSVRNRDREELSSQLDGLVKEGRVCETVGWGTTVILPNGTTIESEKLRKASVRLVSWQVCAQMLCQPPHFYCNDSIFSENRFICGINTGNGESCSRDEGNPLICDGYIFALTTWSPGCGVSGPKIYSALHFGLDFYNAVSKGTLLVPFDSFLSVFASQSSLYLNYKRRYAS